MNSSNYCIFLVFQFLTNVLVVDALRLNMEVVETEHQFPAEIRLDIAQKRKKLHKPTPTDEPINIEEMFVSPESPQPPCDSPYTNSSAPNSQTVSPLVSNGLPRNDSFIGVAHEPMSDFNAKLLQKLEFDKKAFDFFERIAKDVQLNQWINEQSDKMLEFDKKAFEFFHRIAKDVQLNQFIDEQSDQIKYLSDEEWQNLSDEIWKLKPFFSLKPEGKPMNDLGEGKELKSILKKSEKEGADKDENCTKEKQVKRVRGGLGRAAKEEKENVSVARAFPFLTKYEKSSEAQNMFHPDPYSLSEVEQKERDADYRQENRKFLEDMQIQQQILSNCIDNLEDLAKFREKCQHSTSDDYDLYGGLLLTDLQHASQMKKYQQALESPIKKMIDFRKQRMGIDPRERVPTIRVSDQDIEKCANGVPLEDIFRISSTEEKWNQWLQKGRQLEEDATFEALQKEKDFLEMKLREQNESYFSKVNAFMTKQLALPCESDSRRKIAKWIVLQGIAVCVWNLFWTFINTGKFRKFPLGLFLKDMSIRGFVLGRIVQVLKIFVSRYLENEKIRQDALDEGALRRFDDNMGITSTGTGTCEEK